MAAFLAPRRLALCWSRLCFPARKTERFLSSGASSKTAFFGGESERCCFGVFSERAKPAGRHRQRWICTTNFALQAVKRGGAGDRGERDGDLKDGEDDDLELGAGRKVRKRDATDVNAEAVASEPMDYYFSGIPPDMKAARLSDESKEKMWLAYQNNKTPEMINILAETYKIRKQRVHAILWLKDIEKEEAAERGKPLDDDIEKAFEQIHGSYETADDERHHTLPSTRPNFSVMEEGWQGNVKAEGQSVDEVSAKEEDMMVEEFVQRMNFNKMMIARIKNKEKSPHCRPPEGWSYLVEELGPEGKRGKGGGRRYVAQPDGSHRGLNEVEKMFLKRESVRPRRRLTPK